MASVYNLEPQPTGKVLLKTTSGDIVLEIFAKQTALASRNFLQHCLDGYYDNTIFHRLVPGFIIQGGDPTGLGTGGISAINDGLPFADEFHSRLRFNRRGLLGMANSGEPNDNGSQFFLTLDKTAELQGKNTMFGRVEGDTIYNLMRMGEADLAEEGGDRPLYPSSVLGTEILVNPFEDMVRKVQIATRTHGDDSLKTKKRKKAGKNLLSFGAEEGEEVAPLPKKAKVNPSFQSGGVEDAETLNHTKIAKAPAAAKAKAVRPERRQSSPDSSATPPAASRSETKAPAPAPVRQDVALSPSPERPQIVKTTTLLERSNAQIEELKRSMKRDSGMSKEVPEKRVSALEAMIPSTATKGRKRGKVTDEKGALDMFNAFRSKLGQMPSSTTTTSAQDGTKADDKPKASEAPAGGDEDEDQNLCDLHFVANCQSCKSWEDDDKEEADDDANDPSWMAHNLSFAKDTLGKDLEWKRKMEEFEVIDPREKARDLAQDRKKGQKSGGRDWDRQRDSKPTKI